MYSNFELRKTDKGIIQGYLWEIDAPKAVVLIVHGIGEYGGRYDRVASKMNAAGFEVMSMDLRGHGCSVEKKGHCAPRKQVIDDIDTLMLHARHRHPELPIVLYGHSMGGNITLDYRGRGAFNGMPAGYIISAPWITLARKVPKPLYKLVSSIAKVSPTLTMSSTVDEKLLGNPLSVGSYSENPMVHNRISMQCAAECFETGMKLMNGNAEDNGGARNIETLIMHGSEDKICDIKGTIAAFEKLTARGGKVSFIEWPGLYHEIHNGGAESNGDEVIDRAIEFISKVTSQFRVTED